jgi:hypothetical protein
MRPEPAGKVPSGQMPKPVQRLSLRGKVKTILLQQLSSIIHGKLSSFSYQNFFFSVYLLLGELDFNKTRGLLVRVLLVMLLCESSAHRFISWCCQSRIRQQMLRLKLTINKSKEKNE